MKYAIWEPLIELELNFFKSQKSPNYCLCSRAFIKYKSNFDWEVFDKNLQKCKMNNESLPNDKKEKIKHYCQKEIQKPSNIFKILMESLCSNQYICYIVQDFDILNLFCNDYSLLETRKSEIRIFNLQWQSVISWEKLWSENSKYIIWNCWFEKFGAYIYPGCADNLAKKCFFQTLCLVLNKNYKDYQIDYVDQKKFKKFYKFCISYGIIAVKTYFQLIFNVITIGEKKLNFRIDNYFYSDIFKNHKEKIKLFIGNSNNGDEVLNYYLLNQNQNKVIRINKNILFCNYKSQINRTKLQNKYPNYSYPLHNIFAKNLLNFMNKDCSYQNLSGKFQITKCAFSILSNCSASYSDFSSLPLLNNMEKLSIKAEVGPKNIWNYDFYEEQRENFGGTLYDKWEQNKYECKNNDKYDIIKKKNLSDLSFTRNNDFLKTRQYFSSVGYCLRRLEKFHNRNELLKETDFDNQFSDSLSMIQCKSNSMPLENGPESITEKCNSTRRKRNRRKRIRKEKKHIHRKSDTIYQALALMGYSYKKNTENKVSGRVTYWKKNIRERSEWLNSDEKQLKLNLFFDDNEKPYELKSDHKNAFLFEEKIVNPFKEEISKSENNFIELELSTNEPQLSLSDVNQNKQKKNKKKSLIKLPQEIIKNTNLLKYWLRRYELFSRFDKGIKLDEESWFSVTPEALAKHHAERCRCDTIIDAFCGAGGNSIQFAFTCERVIAIDIDPQKIEIAKHNAKIYGVEDRIEFIIGDFTKLAFTLFGDVVFLSPPWGGPNYIRQDVYNLSNILPPIGGRLLFTLASEITENVAYFLPKNADSLELSLLSGPGGEVEIEQNYLGRRIRSLTAYFGELISHTERDYI